MNRLALIRQFTYGLSAYSVKVGELMVSGSKAHECRYVVTLQSLKMATEYFIKKMAASPAEAEDFRRNLRYEESLYFATDSSECLIDMLSVLLLADDDEFGEALDAGEGLLLIDVFEKKQKATNGQGSADEEYEVKLECLADRQSIYDIIIESDWLNEHYIDPMKEGILKNFSELTADLEDDCSKEPDELSSDSSDKAYEA